MSRPKRHHYVPQFYLRRFSKDRRSIRCYNKARSFFIPRASIKGQCAIDNYYSWNDNVEPALGVVEGQVASIISRVAAQAELPQRDSQDWATILMFLALQSARTKLSGDANNAMTDYTAKLWAEGAPELENVDMENFSVVNTFPTATPIEVSLRGFHYLASLRRALIINDSHFPFICSDNPVILYNSQRSRWQDRGVIGLDSSGLQLFFPIDPRHMVYLYDDNAYSAPTNTGCRKIGVQDAIKINLLHYLWSDQNVYFCQSTESRVISAIADVAAPYVDYARVIMRESDLIENEDGTSSSLLHHFRPHAPIELTFGFARPVSVVDDGRVGARSIAIDEESEPTGNERSFCFSNEVGLRMQLRGSELGRGLRSIEGVVRQSSRGFDEREFCALTTV